jgi:hypothetical protein
MYRILLAFLIEIFIQFHLFESTLLSKNPLVLHQSVLPASSFSGAPGDTASSDIPIVLLHGLLGSSKNFQV